MRRLALLPLILAVCVGCLGSDFADSLEGSWQLVSGSVDSQQIPVDPDHPITLTIEGERVNGVAACNSYSGTFDLSGSAITVSDLAMTEMACFPEELMQAEAMYAEAMTRVDSVALDQQLTLTGDGVELVFDPVPPPEAADLTNTVWVLDGLIQGDAVSTPVVDTRATVEFFTDGSMLGDTGCRPFSAQYAVSGDQVTVEGGLASDGHECEPPLDDQDALITSVLSDAFRVEIEGNRLTTWSDDDLGLTFVAES
jgi:heat shock protein HslJ